MKNTHRNTVQGSQPCASGEDLEIPDQPPPNPSLNIEHIIHSGVFAPDADQSAHALPDADRLVPKREIRKSDNGLRNEFRRRFYPKVTRADFNDWKWQLRNRISDYQSLARMLWLSAGEREALEYRSGMLPVAITPYYASLLDPFDADQPLRRTIIPVIRELDHLPGEETDPLGEDHQSPVPGLVHRYPDRVLFLTTNVCSAYCRYCTRSRIMNNDSDYKFSYERWEMAIRYIESHTEVRDVLLSGGDPLTLDDDHIEFLLARLSRIAHVEILRIGTKIPAVLPQRVTHKLTRMLKRYMPLYMSLHFTHPDELTPESARACNMLADAGIPLGSQTVLLAGINDSILTMKQLFHGLLRMRVRPYYLYQCDPVSGTSHLRTSVRKGLEIIQGLRGHTSGYAVPTYVIDAPNGGGKIPLLPEYVMGYDGNDLLLKNYEGKIYRYPDRDQSGLETVPVSSSEQTARQ
ncbi:KamA family radical SAM protein [bacterium]|nr:KamA family radical SAM protein [candidate division CSSED10-310 bacterium]